MRRAMWVVEVPDEELPAPNLPPEVLTGGANTYPACRQEAARLRARGARGIVALAAALLPGAARGWRVDGGLAPARDCDGRTIVLFGRRPDLVGWAASDEGRPRADLLRVVRHFSQ